MRPSVGRIVHYVAHGTPVREDGTQAYPSKCRAAIITDLCDNPSGPDGTACGNEPGSGCVSLSVFNPTGMFFNGHVPYWHADPFLDFRGGTWHWPERVE